MCEILKKYLIRWRYVFIHKCLEHCCFSSRHFLKQLASHVSADTLQLKFLGMKFFLVHPGNLNIFVEGFKVFLRSVNEIQVVAHKKIEKYDAKKVFL